MSLTTATSPTLTFPHPILTPLTAKPNNSSLQVLQRELYANARAVYSARGGGAYGHLAIIMPPADYLARTGVAFVPPTHPGNAPVHGANATSAQITETNRQFAADLAEYNLYRTVNEELKKQILAAVPVLYLAILSDDEMGFAEVTCDAMLAHLRTTYGTITQAELETNRTRLSAEWSPDDAIEDLWLRIREIQRFALAGQEPISDSTALRLTLEVLEKTGVFLSATERWREQDEATWTLPSFQLHFTRADKERRRKLTAQTAGYHGAHLVTPTTGTPLAAASVAIPPAPLVAAQFSVNVDGGTMMYYCWTHGLGRNANHTSLTCSNKAQGHQDTATVRNRMGGSNIIMGGGRPTRRTPPTTVMPTPAPTS
jgi:hypothetical protein